ncbi:MAG: tetratricopeptide repeat protein [Blastocatellia bacterium]
MKSFLILSLLLLGLPFKVWAQPQGETSQPLNQKIEDKKQVTQPIPLTVMSPLRPPIQEISRLPTTALAPRRVLALNERALTALAKGNLAAALADLDAALSLNPEHPQTWHNRGLALTQKGELTMAYANFNHALAIEPLNASAYYQRGRIKSQQENWVGAFADYEHALDVQPNFLPALLARSDLLREMGQFDGALTDVTKYLQLNPTVPEAYYLRATIWQAKENLSQALDDLTQAQTLQPKRAEFPCQRAHVRLLQGDLAGALADYQRALAIGPLPSAYNNRAVILQAQGRIQDALEDLNQAIDYYPAYALAYYNRSQIWQLLSVPEAAQRDLRRAQELAPHRFDLETMIFTYDLRSETFTDAPAPVHKSALAARVKSKRAIIPQ